MLKKTVVFLILLLPILTIGQENNTHLFEDQNKTKDPNTVLNKKDRRIEKCLGRITRYDQKISESNARLAKLTLKHNQIKESISVVKSEMNGLDLDVLTQKVNTNKKKIKSLRSTNSQSYNEIAKKPTRIERIQEDIKKLEKLMWKNQTEIDSAVIDIQKTEEIIAQNELIEKSKVLSELEKELKVLEMEEEKERTFLSKQELIKQNELEELKDLENKKRSVKSLKETF